MPGKRKNWTAEKQKAWSRVRVSCHAADSKPCPVCGRRILYWKMAMHAGSRRCVGPDAALPVTVTGRGKIGEYNRQHRQWRQAQREEAA